MSSGIPQAEKIAARVGGTPPPPLFYQSPEGKGLRGKVLIAMELALVLRG
jgi:hypothetical protein